MSASLRRFVFASLFLLAALVGLSAAQPPDPLEQTRQELTLRSQKLLRDVTATIAEAQLTARTNPEKAREILSKAKTMLEDDNVTLPERQRLDLLRQVDAKIVDAQGRALAQKKADDLAAAASAEKIRLDKKLDADDRKAQAGLTPSMLIGARINSVQAQRKAMLAYLDYIKKQKPDAYYSPTNKESPVFKDIQIMKMLNSTLSVEFMDVPLKKALDYIEEKTDGKMPILLDEPALKEAGVDVNDKMVSLKATRFSVRSILRTILKPNGLDYYLEEGFLRITSEAKAKDQMVIKMYPIRNLITPTNLSPQMMMMQMRMGGMGGANNQSKGAAQSLAMLMMSTIEPKYWEVTAGGPGQVDWDPTSMSLIIKASLEVHYMLKSSQILNNNRPPGQSPLP